MSGIYLTYKTLLAFRATLKKFPNLCTREIMEIIKNNKASKPDRTKVIRDIAIPYTLQFFSLSKEEWNSKSKKAHIVSAGKYLSFALYTRKVLGKMTLENVGSEVRNNKHDLVLYHIRKLGDAIGTYKDIRDSYMQYEKGLKESILLYEVQDIESPPKLYPELESILHYITSNYNKDEFGAKELHIVLLSKENYNIEYSTLRRKLAEMVNTGVLVKRKQYSENVRRRVLYKWTGYNPYNMTK